MIIYKPINTLILLIAMGVQVLFLLIMILIRFEPHFAVLISFCFSFSYLIIRSLYYKNINNNLVANYISEYTGDETAIRYFKKTMFAKREKLANKGVIFNDELRQIPRILQAKKLNSRITNKMKHNYVKLKILAPYMYEADIINVVLITEISGRRFEDYLNAIKIEHLEEGTENIVIFYIENPSEEDYRVIKREMNVNNYIVNDINIKLTFMVRDDIGFILFDNYYFIDYSSTMIKEKYRIKSNVPIPCDSLSKRVNNEIRYKICGI